VGGDFHGPGEVQDYEDAVPTTNRERAIKMEVLDPGLMATFSLAGALEASLRLRREPVEFDGWRRVTHKVQVLFYSRKGDS
jgi:hypothetical protein